MKIRSFPLFAALVALTLCGCDNPSNPEKSRSNKNTNLKTPAGDKQKNSKNADINRPTVSNKAVDKVSSPAAKPGTEATALAAKSGPEMTGTWNLIKKKELPKVSLRGYGAVSGTYWVSGSGGAVLEIACEDKPKAQLLQAKYLSDVQLLPNVKGLVVTNGSQELFEVKAEKQGVIAALRYENNKVYIVAAKDQVSFDKLVAECVSMNGKAFNSKADIEVPMWLDRWDKFGFRFYYRPGETPPGQNLASYDVFQEFEFADKSDRSGFVFWGDPNQVDTAEGQTRDQYWNFGLQAATQRKLPVAANVTVGSGTWLLNRYRDQAEKKAPQFCGNAYHGAASYDIGGKGRLSRCSTTGEDADLAVTQRLVREFSKLPNLTTILEPHGELNHNTEVFMEYGPIADASYQEYLKKKYGTLPALQKAWGITAASWNDIHVPEVASFLGWRADAIDLKGNWKVGYEKFSGGKSYSEHDLRFTLANQVIPTEKAPDEWFSVGFNDSSWPTVVAPGHDRTMFLPQRPAVYRRTFSVPMGWTSKHPRSWIYIWDLNNGSKNIVKVVINGKAVGESPVMHNVPHWCVMETTGIVKDGANQISISLPKGLLAYRIYITGDEPKQYPNLGVEKNNQWADFSFWSVDVRVNMAKRGSEMIRQVDPNRQIDFMAPGVYLDGIKQLAAAYGGNAKNTGYMGGFWADDLPSVMRGAGLPFSVEPGGPAANLPEFKKQMGLWQTEGIQALDYFIHVGSIMWNPEIRKHFEETLPMIKLIGKCHPPKAEIAALSSSLGSGLTGYPWGQDFNTNLSSGYWPWNVRAFLMGQYESDMLTESSFASGDASHYRIIIDDNTSIMDEKMVSEIEKYVRDGGTFITFAQTGRHTPAQKDSWPISRLTGYQVTKIDRLSKDGRPEETRLLVPAAGQNVFSGTWDLPANGLSLKKVATDAKDLMMWQDGSTAIGVRPLGKGFIYQVGCKFTGRSLPDRIEGVPNRECAALIQLFSQLLESTKVAKIEAQLVPNDYKVMLRHYVSNNGLYDVWTLWNRDPKQAAATDLVLPSSVSSNSAWDVQSKKEIPITQGKVAIKLDPLDMQMLLTPRNMIAQAPLDWFELQRNWWQGTTVPPALIASPVLNKFSVDLNQGWAFKPLASGEAVSPELLKSDMSGLEKIRMGVWSAEHPTVKHALLTKTFTVPKEWSGAKVGLWLKLWWGKTFFDKARAWLDGKLFFDWNGDGFADVNPDNALQAGTTHTLAVEIEGAGSLVGSRSNAWLWAWPKPIQVLDLAGAWAPSTDLLTYSAPVNLPGKPLAKSFRRTVIIPQSFAGNNVVLNVDAEGGRGVLGVLINGYFISHEISSLHFQINVTPWVLFGKENEIELVNFDCGPVNIKNVSLELHAKGVYP